MGWFKDGKEVNPEVTGATEVKTEKSAAELIAESLSDFKTTIKAQFDEFGTRLNTVEESTRKPVPVQEPREIPSVYDNEDAAFAARVGPVAMRQMELEARVVLGEVKAEYASAGFGDMWQALEKEIKTVLEQSPLIGGDGRPVRGNPDYIRNTVDMVFGRAARNKGVRFKGSDQTFFLEGGAGDAGTGSVSDAADGLTEGQRRIFKRMGIDPKEGAKTRAKLNFVQ